MNWNEMSRGDQILAVIGFILWLGPAVLMFAAAMQGMYP